MDAPGKPQRFQLEPDLCGCTVDRFRPTIMRSLVLAATMEVLRCAVGEPEHGRSTIKYISLPV
jgi:hypothetical protein